MPANSSLLQLSQLGLKEQRFAADVVGVLLKELSSQNTWVYCLKELLIHVNHQYQASFASCNRWGKCFPGRDYPHQEL